MRIGIILSLGFASGVEALSLDPAASRRDFVGGAIIGSVASAIGAQSSWASDIIPFCVIGANGRTGTKCVQELLERGLPVRATSRSGVYNAGSSSNLLIPTVCDVTQPSTIAEAVQGTRSVIFAASASKQGGTPAQVDSEGLVNVAKACIEAKVPHLVIVSCGGVTRPDSAVYKFLNLLGGIMEEKIKGEDDVRSLYAKTEGGMTYTVIRPGGLTEEPARGVSAMELNQGDTKSGRISRYDVAKLCVEATLFPDLTGGSTFECYDADTGKPLETVGLSNILKMKTDPSEFVTGYERRGETYQELFRGLKKDSV
ncbi:NmrA family protein [Nitzschia inconspicua]|uniref:NmrA family protein n=1 Tax=Nitzschia inconspicua TaxID=303405 RepID=A0A9K3PNC7_9STRA|nr:NmrA family protein [Nitzschia inconspicua]